MMRVLVTGSSGLIGSEAVQHFDAEGHVVDGIDNNMRRQFFGPQGGKAGQSNALNPINIYVHSIPNPRS